MTGLNDDGGAFAVVAKEEPEGLGKLEPDDAEVVGARDGPNADSNGLAELVEAGAGVVSGKEAARSAVLDMVGAKLG